MEFFLESASSLLSLASLESSESLSTWVLFRRLSLPTRT